MRARHSKTSAAVSASSTADRARDAVERAFELALAHLESGEPLPRRAESTPAELHETLGLALSEEGVTLEEVTEKLRHILAETPSSAAPGFFNQLFGGRDPMAVAAEMLTPLTNNSMYTYKVAGPQVLIERELLRRMAAAVGYDLGEGMFSPGGSLANLTAMLLARNEAAPETRDRGLSGARMRVYTSADGHYSVRKAAGILGLGRDSVRAIATDDAGSMRVSALQQAVAEDLAAGWRPLLVNATAGTTVLGAFDPLPAVAEVARQHGLWFHVDGALGGPLALCRAHRHLLDGAALSDSFAWNAHKLMGAPIGCSVLLVAQEGLLARHLGESADYLFQSETDELNPGTRSLQCGRRNDALKLWAAWQLHGDSGYDRRLTRMFELARFAAARIDADPDLELTIEPPSINVCFEVRRKSSVAICERLDREGRLLIGHGLVGRSPTGKRRAIRLVTVNPDLDERDIEAALAEIKAVAADLPSEPGS